ncbi:MAG: response regulator, partial [Anaerolineales bacterium]
MPPSNYRILLVELDHNVGNLLQRQILEPLGYQMTRVESVADAMGKISSFSPDLIITNLSLPGLSGNDLLVALTSQGIDIPVVVMARKGMENNIIRAFRLGACDYLSLPLRETEVVTVTKRVLNQRKAQDARDQLISEFKQTNLVLQHRLDRLTATLSLPKASALVSDLKGLYKRILEVALQATETQRGWILMRQGRENTFIVAAQENSSDDPNSEELLWEHSTNQLAAI